MEFICIKENLLYALLKCERAVSKSSILPALSNILIEVLDGKIKISATDLELAISCWVPGRLIEEGRVAVSSKIFTSLISTIPDGKKISVKKKGGFLEVSQGKSSAKLNILDPKEFPLIPKVNSKESFEFSSKHLSESISRVLVSTSNDSTRPEISSVFLSIKDKNTTLAATDSFRLSERTIKNGIDNVQISFLIPFKTSGELVRVLSDEDGQVTILSDGSQILFRSEKLEILSRLVEGQYPDYKRIVPQEFKTRIYVDKKEFLNAIKTAVLFSGRQNEVFFKAKSSSKNLEIFAKDIGYGEHRNEIKAKIEGENPIIAFSGRFLLDGINSVKDDVLFWGLNGKEGPSLIKGFKEQNFIYVLMPIQA